jgi:hypothetical protein
MANGPFRPGTARRRAVPARWGSCLGGPSCLTGRAAAGFVSGLRPKARPMGRRASLRAWRAVVPLCQARTQGRRALTPEVARRAVATQICRMEAWRRPEAGRAGGGEGDGHAARARGNYCRCAARARESPCLCTTVQVRD